MTPQVIIFIAPPGAGKGTQAENIAKEFGFYHLETSKLIEAKFKNANPNDPTMQEEKRRWLAGELTTPAIFVGWFNEEIKELALQGKSIVTSGSLRTVEETKDVMPELEKLYGRDNIKIFNITLSEEESIRRNSGRRICQLNRHPIPGFPQYRDLTTCPEDGSPIIKRDLDKPEIIKERYRVYKAETEPVLDYLKENGYHVTTINGEQPIGAVFEDVSKHLQNDPS